VADVALDVDPKLRERLGERGLEIFALTDGPGQDLVEQRQDPRSDGDLVVLGLAVLERPRAAQIQDQTAAVGEIEVAGRARIGVEVAGEADGSQRQIGVAAAEVAGHAREHRGQASMPSWWANTGWSRTA
jgi:hypothetical protein